MQIQADDLPQNIISIDNRFFFKFILSNKQNAQGKVFLVHENHIPYAAKIFVNPQHFKEEVFILDRIKEFDYVTKLIYSNLKAHIVLSDGRVDERPVIIMGLVEHGDFCDFLELSQKYNKVHKRIYTIPIPIAKRMFFQILKALEKVHQSGIIHRDLKWQNIVFDSNFVAIVADYGLCYKQNVQGQSIKDGTPGFMAPEVQKDLSISPASDIYVSGILFYRMCFFSLPFNKFNDENYKNFNKKNNEKLLQLKWKSIEHNRKIVIPTEVKQVFCNIFKQNQEQRPTINQILTKQFMEGMATQEEVKKHMQTQYNMYTAGNAKIHRIREILQQLRMQRQAQQNQRTENVPQQQRTRKKTSSVGIFARKANKRQNLEKKQLEKQDIPLNSSPGEVLGWIEYYLNHQIRNQKLGIQYLLEAQETLSFQVPLFSCETKFSIEFQIKNNQYEDEDPFMFTVYGKFYQLLNDNRICVTFSKGKDEQFYSEMLLRQLRDAIITLSVYEAQTVQNPSS